MTPKTMPAKSTALFLIAPKQGKSLDVELLISFPRGVIKHRTIPSGGASLFLVEAKKSQPPELRCPVDFQDRCSRAMDQAMGIEIDKVSLATVVNLNSCLIDAYKNALCFTPAFGDLLGTTAKSFALCMDLQMSGLNLLASHPLSRVSTNASGSGRGDEPTAEELAHGMDIAIGEMFTGTVASSSGGLAQPKAAVLEHSMEIAVGARAA